MIDEILDFVASVPEMVIKKPHSYIIVGKPGSGKSCLATKLAELTRTRLINAETCVADMSASQGIDMVEVPLEYSIYMVDASRVAKGWCSTF